MIYPQAVLHLFVAALVKYLLLLVRGLVQQLDLHVMHCQEQAAEQAAGSAPPLQQGDAEMILLGDSS